MKKKLILFAVPLAIALGALVTKAHATLPGNRAIIVILCYDESGNVTGLGNTCSDGGGSCVTNFCNTPA